MKITRLSAFVILLFWGALQQGCQPKSDRVTQNVAAVTNRPYVVMLSMDGFRWDYTLNVATPHLDAIADSGVRAVTLRPCFPTKTFPNHYSIATGLYPDHHGIVNNSFYDPDMKAHYSLSDPKATGNGVFYGGEPLWVTAARQGMVSASYFWVGTEAPIKGIRPAYWKAYDKDITFSQEIDTVVYWLTLPEERRPHLILFYFNEPDVTGHDYGPGSPQIISVVARLDSLTGVLMRKLKQLPCYQQVNVIITSDHGMSRIEKEKTIYLEDYVRKGWFEAIEGSNPCYNLTVLKKYTDTVYSLLKAVPHMEVWKHGHVPARLHYGDNPRDGDLIVVADSSWSLRWRRHGHLESGGTHGYDNNNTDMQAIFYAMGPAFRVGYVQPLFDNIDIYLLVTNILGLKPAANDGTWEHVAGMLHENL
jgi:predicted AlkP superfamily pyrophosphatase or phosphodiesterase